MSGLLLSSISEHDEVDPVPEGILLRKAGSVVHAADDAAFAVVTNWLEALATAVVVGEFASISISSTDDEADRLVSGDPEGGASTAALCGITQKCAEATPRAKVTCPTCFCDVNRARSRPSSHAEVCTAQNRKKYIYI